MKARCDHCGGSYRDEPELGRICTMCARPPQGQVLASGRYVPHRSPTTASNRVVALFKNPKNLSGKL